MTTHREPYDYTHQCLVKVHPGYFVVVYPDQEDLDQTQCSADSVIYDVLHDEHGKIASESSCCPRHAFQNARRWIEQHENETEQPAQQKSLRISEAARRKRQANRLARIPATPVG